jgi:hypothetical protein
VVNADFNLQQCLFTVNQDQSHQSSLHIRLEGFYSPVSRGVIVPGITASVVQSYGGYHSQNEVISPKHVVVGLERGEGQHASGVGTKGTHNPLLDIAAFVAHQRAHYKAVRCLRYRCCSSLLCQLERCSGDEQNLCDPVLIRRG